VTWSGPITGNVHRDYDNNFRVKSESVNGTAVNFTYDNDDLLTDAGVMSIGRDPALRGPCVARPGMALLGCCHGG